MAKRKITRALVEGAPIDEGRPTGAETARDERVRNGGRAMTANPILDQNAAESGFISLLPEDPPHDEFVRLSPQRVGVPVDNHHRRVTDRTAAGGYTSGWARMHAQTTSMIPVPGLTDRPPVPEQHTDLAVADAIALFHSNVGTGFMGEVAIAGYRG